MNRERNASLYDDGVTNHSLSSSIINHEEAKHVQDVGLNEPLRIFILTWEFPPNILGGLAAHTYGLATALNEVNCEVHVLTSQRPGLEEYENMNGVHIHRVTPLNQDDPDFSYWIGGLNLAMVRKAMDLVEKNHLPSLIHAHDWLVCGAAISLKNTLRVPLLATIHATEYGRNNGIHTELQRFIYQKEQQLINEANQVIVCSDFMKNELLSVFDATEKEIAVLPNGIHCKMSSNESHSFVFPHFPEKAMVFSLGRIVKEKGFETLIAAAKIAKEMKIDVYFLIGGKGPMLEGYRQKVRDLGLEEDVFFLGYIDNNQRDILFSECDIAVFPSLYEPFGIVALESMSQGVPTIVSETGGLKGIVKHLQTGMQMDPGNAEDLVNHLLYLIKNPKQAEQMGQNGKKIVESMYSWTRVATNTMRLMQDLVLLHKVDTENDLKDNNTLKVSN
ncbi:Glycosyltransferase involved in cell wall bisynthesis [Bacillus sp. cl95]|nr:Glycosyltransferase involved in cell wall bisynthesis [Bacillus sp. UNCCL13]SFQ79633.1 Glycosyltransferase involved in cell wall bisynthesis [Bacillus sp. cl95]